MSTYRIEFGPAWPVPPITVDFADPNQAARAVASHAIPHLTPMLAAKGRPELADCFFRTNRECTVGEFMWIDLAGDRAARFCPARLIPVEVPDADICGDQNDDEVCDLDPGHNGDHCANVTVGWAR
ncbi:hypothetical protein ABZX82_01800 [Streptomyces griseoflavus]|uniref:hypothetical protein n=1 Tax=Streptomyces griseoflavus TaxID=35619 RepID=UPI0033AE2AEF